MAEPSTTWVRKAHGDAWQTLAVTTHELPGVRLSATGLPHPQWNNGDVDDPAAVDVGAVRDWYDALRVPWAEPITCNTPGDLPSGGACRRVRSGRTDASCSRSG